MSVSEHGRVGGPGGVDGGGAEQAVRLASDDAAACVVQLRLPPRPALIPTVRAVASDLAIRAGFGSDAVSDLRMAVDEASAALMERVHAGDELCCAFAVGPDRIEVTVSGRPDPAHAVVDTGGFGWRILRSLTDELDVLPATDAPDAGPGPGSSIGIRLVKNRAS